MDDNFDRNEKLYRAVYPPEVVDMFWKRDGSVSSAAFADARGLSVDRGDYRNDDDVVRDMNSRFRGSIIRVYAKNCMDTGAVLRYLPTRKNIYHTEIHGSEQNPLLSRSQRRFLACRAVIVNQYREFY